MFMWPYKNLIESIFSQLYIMEKSPISNCFYHSTVQFKFQKLRFEIYYHVCLWDGLVVICI